jgi:hypothetical protein
MWKENTNAKTKTMNAKRKLLAIVLLMMAGTAAWAQTTLDMEFRPRMEYRQGFRKPLNDTLQPAFVTLQRTRLNADYKGKILNARLSMQDARIWGNSDTKTSASKLEVYEAWFEYLMSSGFSTQMGRQALKYDDQRLLAAPNWSNTGQAHDAMVLKYNSSFLQAHSGYAYNNSKDTLMNVSYAYASKVYKAMGYLWLSKTITKGTTLSMIGIVEGFEKKTDIATLYPRATYGGNLVYANDSSAWGATLTAYHQSGKTPMKKVGNGYADLNANLLAAKVSYRFMPTLQANVGVDYYSGSKSDIAADKSTTFNRLYGAVHSFNGSMEYFSTLPTQGLLDYYVGVNARISPAVSVDATSHFFSFDKDFYYNKAKCDKSLGSEIDLSVNYVVSKEIAIQGGFSQYFNSGTTAKYFKMDGVDTHPQQWAYIMLTVKPQLYKTPAIVENK